MAAKDTYHEIVKHALEAEGWVITHDPYTIDNELFSNPVFIDIAAEKLIAAEKGTEKIAVEVKTFGKESLIYEFHSALGQILNYKLGLEEQEPDRVLILAIPLNIYENMMKVPIYQRAFERYSVQVLVYDIDNEKITLWQS